MSHIKYSELKVLAERVIKHLLIDAEFTGIKFDWPTIFIDSKVDSKMVRGQIYLMCESKFAVYVTCPTMYPKNEEELSNINKDIEIKLLSI